MDEHTTHNPDDEGHHDQETTGVSTFGNAAGASSGELCEDEVEAYTSCSEVNETDDDAGEDNAQGDEAVDDEMQEEEAEVLLGVPEEYAALLGERPTLWYESADEFDDLQNAVFLDRKPKDFVSALYVRDFVEFEWDLRRNRRLKRAAINSQLPLVAIEALGDTSGPLLNIVGDRTNLTNIARGSAMGISDAKRVFKERASKKLMRPVDLHYQAHIQSLKILEALDREAQRLHHSRERVLKLLDARDRDLGAMARSFIRREEAETVDPVITGPRAV